MSANAEKWSLGSVPSTVISDPDLDFHGALLDAKDNNRFSAIPLRFLGAARFCMAWVKFLGLPDAAHDHS